MKQLKRSLTAIKKIAGVTHAIAECADCAWKSEAYKNAVANAARHARAYGHKVIAEQCIAIEYTPVEHES